MIRVGAVIVAVAALAALVGPLLTPYDPSAQALALRLQGPSLAHPLGLDERPEGGKRHALRTRAAHGT